MTTQVPYHFEDINFNNIVFKKDKMIKGKKFIFLKYKDNSINNFVIQLSKINKTNIINSNEIEFEISNNNLSTFLNKLDDYIISTAKDNSSKWFDHIDDLSSINYHRILNNSNNIKLKIINNETFKTNIILDNENITNLDNINLANTKSKIILEIYAIWIKNNTFGLLLRPINILIKYIENNSYIYKFLDDSDNDSNNDSVNDSINNLVNDSVNNLVNDSDNNSINNSDNDSINNSDNDSVNNSDNELDSHILFIKNNNIPNSLTTSSDTIDNDFHKLILG
jgi:hypothetical protein